MMCQRIGRPPTSTMGFGRTSVSSANRVPIPPAKMTTFIVPFSRAEVSSSLLVTATRCQPSGRARPFRRVNRVTKPGLEIQRRPEPRGRELPSVPTNEGGVVGPRLNGAPLDAVQLVEDPSDRLDHL